MAKGIQDLDTWQRQSVATGVGKFQAENSYDKLLGSPEVFGPVHGTYSAIYDLPNGQMLEVRVGKNGEYVGFVVCDR